MKSAIKLLFSIGLLLSTGIAHGCELEDLLKREECEKLAFDPIPPIQQVGKPFEITIRSNDTTENRNIYLHCEGSEISARYLKMKNGVAKGYITFFSEGVNFSIFTRADEVIYPESNLITVLNKDGELPADAEIQGTVTKGDFYDYEGISDAKVELILQDREQPMNYEVVATAFSDSNGEYSITDIVPGKYIIKITHEKFEDYCDDQILPAKRYVDWVAEMHRKCCWDDEE